MGDLNLMEDHRGEFFFCQINFEWTYGILVVTAGELKDFYSSFILLNELFRVFLFVI